MKIVADENIPYLQECFGQSAEVIALNGRNINNADLLQADALIIRSVTPVTRELLAGTPVRFVGSCTIGIDHVDTDYLDEAGIAFASAPGSNADSAAQYTLSALLALEKRQQFDLREKTVGIVGYGNVGTRLKLLLDALGVRCLVNDPFLQERGRAGLCGLDDVLQADIISFHVPLSRGGPHSTYQMINAQLLQRMNPQAMLVNCARGDIIDAQALIADMSASGRKVVLDVWPNEPRIDELLLSMVQIATPHIAGYSFDGKLRGTKMVYSAFCKAMGVTCTRVELAVPEPEPILIADGASLSEALQQATLRSYDILEDDAALREMLHEARPAQGAFFDALRKNYAVRREYGAFTCYAGSPAINACLAKLGFQLHS